MAAVGSRLAAVAAVDGGHWHSGGAEDPLSVTDAVAAGRGGAPFESNTGVDAQTVCAILLLEWHS